jgi:hypothetical protein
VLVKAALPPPGPEASKAAGLYRLPFKIAKHFAGSRSVLLPEGTAKVRGADEPASLCHVANAQIDVRIAQHRFCSLETQLPQETHHRRA